MYCDEGASTAGTGDCDESYFCSFGAPESAPAIFVDDLSGRYGSCQVGHYCSDGIMYKCAGGTYQDSELRSEGDRIFCWCRQPAFYLFRCFEI